MSEEGNPERTHAIVAVRFIKYLGNCHVPAKNITAFVAPLPENAVLIEQIKPFAAKIEKQPTAATINDLLTKTLPSLTSALLFFYWAGHGIITVEGQRRLFTADATTADKRNLDLNDLMATLRTHVYPGLNKQAIIVDTCANYVHNPTISLPVTQFPKGDGVAGREQFALLAAAPGEYAKNLNAEKSGLLSRELMNALNNATRTGGAVAMRWPPNLTAIAQQLTDRFVALRRAGEARQAPTTLMFRDWGGSEQHLSQVNESAVEAHGLRPKEPWRLRFDQKRTLTECLLACPTLSNPDNRAAVMADLTFAGAVSRNSSARIDVLNIVTTASNYPGGFEELLEIVYFFEGNSQPWHNLEDAAIRILPNFRAPSLESKEGF